MTMSPPWLAERALASSLTPGDRDVVLGDLAEEFSQRASRGGIAAARRWYWRQCRASFAANLRGRWDASRGAPLSGRSPGPRLFGGVMRDLHDAWRGLRATPSFTIVALAILALGIGASTAIFSVVDAVVLRDLPFHRSDQLVLLAHIRADRRQPTSLAAQDYLDWVAQQTAFEGLAAATGADAMTLEGSQPEALRGIRATRQHVLRAAGAARRLERPSRA